MTMRRSCRGLAVFLVACALSACAAKPRPTPPEAGAPLEHAWGAVPFQASAGGIDKEFTAGIIDSLLAKREQLRQAGEDGKIPYRALTLSGGGSRGAYGAGVLSGWTKRGDRPQFEVVTGISTGALMATHVFLGSEFDDDLAIYKDITNDQVFVEHGMLATLISALRSPSAFDTAPLRETLLTIISEETLDLVAAEHRKGRRLFIGSTNLDANIFTVWDMGVIAESDRPDRLKHYIDIIMASAAFPIAFPPVYIDVEGEDGDYTQMHADGGVRETAFFFDFDSMEEFRVDLEAAGFSDSDFDYQLYLLINGPISFPGSKTYQPVEGRVTAVADATITSLMTKVTQGSVYRLWVLAMANGADFHISFVPPDYTFFTSSLTFDPVEGAALFELGYQQALDGTAWATQRAPSSNEELIKLIVDPASAFASHEPPAWLKRGEQ
jgi:predicted patatin/cPLA2 family phospholipase